MKSTAASPVGETRTCPHCKSTILKSATACPACHHFLRFDAVRASRQPSYVFEPLRIEGTVRLPSPGVACEYSVIVAVHNEQGEELSRRAVAVGGFDSSETRKFTVYVEVYTPEFVG